MPTIRSGETEDPAKEAESQQEATHEKKEDSAAPKSQATTSRRERPTATRVTCHGANKTKTRGWTTILVKAEVSGDVTR